MAKVFCYEKDATGDWVAALYHEGLPPSGYGKAPERTEVRIIGSDQSHYTINELCDIYPAPNGE